MNGDGPNKHLDHLRWLESVYGSVLYARGFYLASTQPRFVPAEWAVQEVGGDYLYYDALSPMARAAHNGRELILLGEAFDIRDPQASNADVAAQLLRAAAASDDALYRETDWLHGRFLLLHRSPSGDLKALTDATGMRAVFHTLHGGSIGSHSSLVAVNESVPEAPRHRGRFGYPGRMTSYHAVVILPPNHALAVETGAIDRFYPREPLEEMPVQDAARLAHSHMDAALEGLLQRFPRLVASLTAGIDSRTTLAVSRRALSQVRFYTYFGGSSGHSVDRVVAEHIAKDFGLTHQGFDIGTDTSWVPTSFTELCKQHSHYLHSLGSAYAYTEHFDRGSDVHMRSNLSEIGRSFYFKTHGIQERLTTGADLARAYMAFGRPGRTGSFGGSEQASIERDFEEFYKAADFDAARGLRDLRDILYWEHRMGSWHSLVVLHSDPAFQTVSLFNARVVLDALLSAPPESRAASATNEHLIELAWPELLQLPINPKSGALKRLFPAT